MGVTNLYKRSVYQTQSGLIGNILLIFLLENKGVDLNRLVPFISLDFRSDLNVQPKNSIIRSCYPIQYIHHRDVLIRQTNNDKQTFFKGTTSNVLIKRYSRPLKNNYQL